MRSVTTNKVRSFKPIKLPSSESCTPFLKAVMVFIILTHVIAVQRISTMYCMPVFCHFIGRARLTVTTYDQPCKEKGCYGVYLRQ